MATHKISVKASKCTSCLKMRHPLSHRRDTQQTVIQQTVEQDNSNIRKTAKSKKVSRISQNSGEPTTDVLESTSNSLGQREASYVTEEHDENRQVISAYIEDFAREFSDQASLKSSTTRAVNLLHQSELPPNEFISRMLQARSMTKERSASIRSQDSKTNDRLQRKHKMAYFFAVLEDLLGSEQDTGERDS